MTNGEGSNEGEWKWCLDWGGDERSGCGGEIVQMRCLYIDSWVSLPGKEGVTKGEWRWCSDWGEGMNEVVVEWNRSNEVVCIEISGLAYREGKE